MFTGVYIIFLISAENIDCGYSLEPPHRGSSNEYLQSMFWAEIRKISEFSSENFHFLVVKFSIYLNRSVFVMRQFKWNVNVYFLEKIFQMPSVGLLPSMLSVKITSLWNDCKPGPRLILNEHNLRSIGAIYMYVKYLCVSVIAHHNLFITLILGPKANVSSTVIYPNKNVYLYRKMTTNGYFSI